MTLALCEQCKSPIDRAKLFEELAKIDIHETARRAADSSVYCGYHCLLEAIAAEAARRGMIP